MSFVDEFDRGKQEAWLPQRAGATPAEMEGRRVAGGVVSDGSTSGGGGGILGFALLVYGLLLAAGGIIVAVLSVVGTPILFLAAWFGASRPQTLKWGRTYVTVCCGMALALVAGLLATIVARGLETSPPPVAPDFASMWPRFLSCRYAWQTLFAAEACALFFFSLIVQYRLRPAFSGALGYLKALSASGLSFAVTLGPLVIHLGTAPYYQQDIAAVLPPRVSTAHSAAALAPTKRIHAARPHVQGGSPNR